jgi:hypothetical protein
LRCTPGVQCDTRARPRLPYPQSNDAKVGRRLHHRRTRGPERGLGGRSPSRQRPCDAGRRHRRRTRQRPNQQPDERSVRVCERRDVRRAPLLQRRRLRRLPRGCAGPSRAAAFVSFRVVPWLPWVSGFPRAHAARAVRIAARCNAGPAAAVPTSAPTSAPVVTPTPTRSPATASPLPGGAPLAHPPLPRPPALTRATSETVPSLARTRASLAHGPALGKVP